MRRSGGPVLEARADTDDADREVMEYRAVANEFVWPQRGERNDGVQERDVPAVGQPGRDPDHVLLGDADVDELSRERLGERFERHEPQVRGEQQDAAVEPGDLDERSRQRCSHVAATSAIASAYSSADIGM